MNKTKVTRSLLAACSIVALTAVMYGCVHSGSDDAATVDPEPKEPPAMEACATVAECDAELTTAKAALADLEADDDATLGQIKAAKNAVTKLEARLVAVTPPPPPPPPAVVELPDGHGLTVGTTTIPPGSTMVGDTTITCDSADGCMLTVTKDPVTGLHSATSTGGMVTVMVAMAPPPKPEPEPMALALPSDHGLKVDPGKSQMFTVAAGDTRKFGMTNFSCPADGAACVVTVTNVLGTISAT